MLAGVSLLAASAPCLASVRHPELARKAYAHAVALRQELEAKPAKSRTQAEYKRVIQEFRNVYFYDFAYTKAPVAAEAMGDLFAEMGRLFSNPAYFRASVKAYQYVMSQYPSCSMARDSWLSMGKVYLDGLKDPSQAANTFRSFLKEHPSSAQSDEARKRLSEIADMLTPRNQQGSSSNGNSSNSKGATSSGKPVEVTEIHDWVGPNYTRVVIGAEGPFKYNTMRLSQPDRIVFDLPNTHLGHSLVRRMVPVNGDFLHDIRVGQFKPNVTRVVLDVKNFEDYSAFPLPNPFRLIIDVHGSSPRTARNEPGRSSAPHAAREVAQGQVLQASVRHKAAAVKSPVSRKTAGEVEADKRVEKAANQKIEVASNRHTSQVVKQKIEVASNHPVEPPAKRKIEVASDRHVSNTAKRKVKVASIEPDRREIPISTKPASPTENGAETLTRALGLKVERIVIDPGHGGFDTGTIGPTGLEEKNVVLDVALRLRKLFETRTKARVFMTRTTDKFVPLEERTAFANEKDADLFISIHANANPDHQVRGIATYFLNFTSDPEALKLAARENATSQESVHQLQNLIKKIALNNKIEESQQLARDIQTVLYRRISRISPGIHNYGVRKAPFVVLIGANMPSVLAEISFLSNPHSEHLLRQPWYREDIAKALFSGIEDYITNLGSVRVAQRTQ